MSDKPSTPTQERSPEMISPEAHKEELERVKRMSEMGADLKHLSKDMIELKLTNREVLKRLESVQLSLTDYGRLSSRLGDLEDVVEPLTKDLQTRQGARSWMNDLGVQAPMWIAVIAVVGMAFLNWIKDKNV